MQVCDRAPPSSNAHPHAPCIARMRRVRTTTAMPLLLHVGRQSLGRYCGVSYLVFSEVKALEKRTLAAEQAMEMWRVRCTGRGVAQPPQAPFSANLPTKVTIPRRAPPPPSQDKIARVKEVEEEVTKLRGGLQEAWAAHSVAVRALARVQGEHDLATRSLQEQLTAARLGAVCATMPVHAQR